MAFGFGDEKIEESLILDEPDLKLTNDQKLGMIVSLLKDKMDSQQLKHAIREIEDILNS